MMKAQVTSILLCALLSSTWGHEYLSAKRLAPEARSKFLSPLSQFQERAATQQCQWVCQGGAATGQLQILVNETVGLVGIVNATAAVALVVDINANLVGLFNGTSGDFVIINIKSGVGVYVTGSQTTSVWISSKQSFELYFKNFKSLQVLIDLKVGTSFKVSTIPEAILKAVAHLLAKLSSKIAVMIKGNLKLAKDILINVSSSIISSLEGKLKGLLKLFGKGLIALHGDILWFVEVLKGLELFFSKVKGGLDELLRLKVEFDLAVLFRAASGVELLVNLLLSIVPKVDLGEILGDFLNSVDEVIAVIVKLGGNVAKGITGLFKVISEIADLHKGSLKLEVLIETLMEFGIQEKASIDISVSIKGLHEVISIQESLHGSASIKALVTFVENLQSGKLIIGGIDVSEVMSALIKGAGEGVMNLVVLVLLKLKAIVNAAEAIPKLLMYLLGLLNSVAGAHVLKLAIPEISVDVTVSSNSSIIFEVFHEVNIQSILKVVLTGFDINAVLTSVPVFGQIYKAISSAVSASSNGSLSLSTILKSSGSVSIVEQIKEWIKAAIKTAQSGISGHIGLSG